MPKRNIKRINPPKIPKLKAESPTERPEDLLAEDEIQIPTVRQKGNQALRVDDNGNKIIK